MRLAYLIALFSLIVCAKYTDALLAAMSVDFGNEYMKIALVKPGVPMEMVLNRESKRKTRTILSIRKDEREFGDNAMTVRLRYPKNSYAYVVELLGKKYDHPYVDQFKKWFPFHNIVADPIRGSILFEDSGRLFSPEELVAMLLDECRDLAEQFAAQPVRDVVVTVPPFWNQVERRAMAKAVSIADLNLLQLMNDNTAAGVNYGMFRRKEFNETATRVLIYDMGALKTTATVYEIQVVQDQITKSKDPQMTVLGVGYDRTLGGLEMTMRLRDHLAKLFRDQHGKKSKTDIGDNDRAMLKLLKEAERVKQVLSANQDHFAQVEGLHEDIDFRAKVTREDLDNLCAEFYARVPVPVTDALKMAELSVDKLDYIVLMGAGTRSLKVQEKLQAAVSGRDLGKYLNTDEAVAMGAVYQAAHLSKGFKVKKFLIKDIVLFPIEVDFSRMDNTTTPESRRIVRRGLFSFKNHYPQKKVMSFQKYTKDFEFCVNYGNMAYLKKEQLQYFGELNLTRVDLHDVAKALNSKEGEGGENKGIKVHFYMDESGILRVDSAEVVFEKAPKEGENETEDAPSTFQKIGKTLSNLFGGGSDDKKEDGAETKEKKPEDEKAEKAEKKEEKKTEDTKEKTEETGKEEKKEEPKEKAGDEKKADSKKEKTDKKADKKKTSVKPKPKIVKVPLKLERSPMDLPDMTSEAHKEAVDRLKSFQKLEKEKRDREKAHNTLEAFVFETMRQLDEKEIKSVSTDKERDTIMQKLKEVSEWLEEQGVATATKDFENKLKALKDASKDLFYKVQEQKERPRLIEAVKHMLNHSTMFMAGIKNLTAELQIFTETEVGNLEKLINETEKWQKEKQEEQSKLAPHESPVLTSAAMMEKYMALDRELKYLINKAKRAPPPKPKKEETTTKNETETSDEKEKNETDGESGSGEEIPQQDKTGGETVEDQHEGEVEVEEPTTDSKPTTDEEEVDEDKHIEL